MLGGPDGGVEQDGLEDLALDNDEGEPEQAPGGSSRYRLAELVSNIALPCIRLALAMHPDTYPQQNYCRDQRSEPLGEFAVRPTDGDEVGRRYPGKDAAPSAAIQPPCT